MSCTKYGLGAIKVVFTCRKKSYLYTMSRYKIKRTNPHGTDRFFINGS